MEEKEAKWPYKRIWKIVLVYSVLAVVVFFYYDEYKSIMPAAYFWLAFALITIAVIGKFYAERSVKNRFSDSPNVVRVVDWVFDAMLVVTLIALFLWMHPSSPVR
jgi:hypothetical protein